MKNAVSVHVVYRFNQLVHVVFDPIFWQIMPFAFYCVIHVHVHKLENEGQPPGGLITFEIKITISKCLAMAEVSVTFLMK